MKKFIGFLSVLFFGLALIGCGTKTTTIAQTDEEAVAEAEGLIILDVNSASVMADFYLTRTTIGNGVSVEWTSSNTELVKIVKETVKLGEDTQAYEYWKAEVTLVPAGGEPTTVNLTATLTKGEVTSTVTEKVRIAVYEMLTIAEVKQKNNGESVKTKGVVVYRGVYSAEYNNFSIMMQDATGGILVYRLKGEDYYAQCEVGNEIVVSGPYSPYSGLAELGTGSSILEVVSKGNKVADPVDVTSFYANTTEIEKYQSLWVTLTGDYTINVVEEEANRKYHINLMDAEGKKFTELFVHADYYPNLSESVDDILALNGLKFESATGILYWYSAQQILLTDVEKVKTAVLTDETRVDADLLSAQNLFEENYDEDTEITLPTKGAQGSKLTWEVTSEDTTVLANNVLSLVKTEAEQTITLKVTATYGEITKEATVTLKVEAIQSFPEFEVVSEVAVDTPYMLYLEHEKVEKDLFFNGKMDGYYYGTGTNKYQGVNVYLETATNGYYLYFLGEENAKKYLNIVASDEHINVKIQAEATSVWAFNTEHNTLTTLVGETEYFLGTSSSKTFTTLSACAVSKFDSSFVSHLVKINTYYGEVTPTAGNGYYLGMYQGNLNKTLYFTGKMDGYYYATSENASDAVKVFAETNGDGFNLYFLGEENAKKYLNIVVSGDHTNVKIEDAVSSVWKYNAEYNTFTTVAGETEYFLGTRSDKSYTTLSACKASYLSSNFVSHTYDVDYQDFTVTVPETLENAVLTTTTDLSVALNYLTKVEFSLTVSEGYTATVKANGKKVEVIDGKFTVTVLGDTEVTVAVEVDLNLKLAATLSFADKANRTSQDADKQVWTQNGVTFTNEKESSTTNVADYANPVRCYAASSIKIEYTAAFRKLVITTAGGKNFSTETMAGAKVVVEGNVATFTFETAVTSATIEALANQVRIATIEVYTE